MRFKRRLTAFSALSLSILLVRNLSAYGYAEKNTGQERVSVLRESDGATAPVLIPVTQPFQSPEKCKSKVTGTIRLSTIIDSHGVPRNIRFIDAAANDLDKLALLILDTERFKPGRHGDIPVAVARQVKFEMKGCFEDIDNGTGKKQRVLRLSSAPTQEASSWNEAPKQVAFGPTVQENQRVPTGTWNPAKILPPATEPKLIRFADAEFSDAARQAHISGSCTLTLVVDSNGMPVDLRVVRGLGWGLDEEAIKAVARYRFQPAELDGMPIPASISVVVNFKIN